MWNAGSWLHRDNMPAQTALSIRRFLAKHSIPTLPQPLFSSDLSPPEFFLFPKLKITLKRRFQRVEDIIANVMNDLKAILQASFEHYFQNRKVGNVHCYARGLF
jgi:transposase